MGLIDANAGSITLNVWVRPGFAPAAIAPGSGNVHARHIGRGARVSLGVHALHDIVISQAQLDIRIDIGGLCYSACVDLLIRGRAARRAIDVVTGYWIGRARRWIPSQVHLVGSRNPVAAQRDNVRWIRRRRADNREGSTCRPCGRGIELHCERHRLIGAQRDRQRRSGH